MITLIIGLSLRLFLIINSKWRIDFDEAFNGILAFGIQQGKLYLFTPPEVLGGTASPYLLAIIFSILGASAQSFRLLSLLWSALYILSIAYMANLAYGERISKIAGLLASLAPPYMLFVGLKLWSSYIETILLGNLLIIAAYHLLSAKANPTKIRWIILCGLTAGLMFWLTWLGFYYFLPVGLVLLWHKGRWLITWGWIGVLAFLVGSLPFWIFNIPRGMPTFQRFVSDAPMTTDQILRVFADFVAIRFPLLVSGHSTWGYAQSPLALVVAIIYALGLVMILRHSRKSSINMILGLLLPSIVLLYCLSTNSRNALPEFNPWGIDATGRYLLMLHSILPIGLALLIQRFSLWRRNLAFILLLIVLSINVLSALRIDVRRAFDSPYYDRLPDDLTPLIDFLEKRDVHEAWVDGGIGHVIMFLTQEGIRTEDYHSVFLSGGLIRLPEVLEAVQSANPTVFITPIYSGQQNPPLQQVLDSANIDYEMTRVTSTLIVYIIPENIDPMRVASGLGYQY